MIRFMSTVPFDAQASKGNAERDPLMNRQAPNQDAGIIPWPSGIPYEEARQLYEKSQESLRLHIENVEQDPQVSDGRIRNLNLDYDLPGPEVAEGAADTAEIDIEALLKSLGIDPDVLISDMVKKPPLENPDKTERRNAVSGRVWGWFIDPNNHKTAMSVLGGLPDGGRPEPYDRQFGMPQRLVRGGLRFGAPDHNPHQISLLEVHPEKELQIKRK